MERRPTKTCCSWLTLKNRQIRTVAPGIPAQTTQLRTSKVTNVTNEVKLNVSTATPLHTISKTDLTLNTVFRDLP